MSQKLSIVIIGRNEEASIGKCLEFAISAAEEVGGGEVIFVDSASTDKTISIVESYGIRVIEMSPEMKLSPSAGRYVGTQYANGEFILFVDADTLVYKGFLASAINHIEHNPRIAGINGWLDDLNEKGEVLVGVEPRSNEVAKTKWLRGPACFYRKSALVECGTFNPFLMVEEEAELGLRIKKHGWELVILPILMGCHTRCYHHQTLSSVINAFRRDIRVSRVGETTKTIGMAFKGGFGLEFCWLRLKTTIFFGVWVILLALCLFLPEMFHPIALFDLVLITIAVAVLIKKRSIQQTLMFFATKLLILIDVFVGIPNVRIQEPGVYKMDVKIHDPIGRA